jgi:hypothetical protein
MKLGRMGIVQTFKKAVLKHFKETVRVYGAGILIPKHHAAAMHLAEQYEADGFVLDTLPVERLHQVPKGFGCIAKNLEVFEKSVLVRCIAHQRRHLEQFDERARLLGNTHDVPHFTLSKSMYMMQGLTIAMNDVVLLQTNVLAVVECCGKNASDYFSYVHSMQSHRRETWCCHCSTTT